MLSTPIVDDDGYSDDHLRMRISNNLTDLHIELERLNDYRHLKDEDGCEPLWALLNITEIAPNEDKERAVLYALLKSPAST